MASPSGASATNAQAGYHQAQPVNLSALGSKDSAAEETPKAAPCLNAHLHGALHNNHESLNPITAHIESYHRGSELIYDPLQHFLDETPREQPWSTPACLAKRTEKDTPGR